MPWKYHDRWASSVHQENLKMKVSDTQQSENSILALTCLESARDPNTIVLEDSFFFPTVIYMA
jgi:hypothetical protein